MTGSHDVDGAREALSLLAHELRLGIVLAALDGWKGARTEPKSYSELMDAVGIADSGKFNYHLDELRGVYLHQTDEGYVPTASATALYRAALATQPTATGPRTLSVSATCPDCGRELAASYERGFLTVSCPRCGDLRGDFTVPFPEHGFEGRSDDEVLTAARRRIVHDVDLARTGQCPDCAGTVDATITHDVGAGSGSSQEDGHDVELACRSCSWLVVAPLLVALQLDTRVAAALARLGYADADWLVWGVPRSTATPATDGPGDVAVELVENGRTATVVVDDDLTVRRVALDGEEL